MNILFCITISILIVIFLSIIVYLVDLKYILKIQYFDISNDGLFKEYIHLINYLLNPFNKNLKFYYFDASQSGLQHFSDVKQLFLINNIILIFSGVVKKKWKIKLEFYKTDAIFIAIIPILLGMLMALDFEDFFVMFHQVLFSNNNWLFNPVMDPIINVLPEQFFEQLIIIFMIIFEFLIFKGFKNKKKSRI